MNGSNWIRTSGGHCQRIYNPPPLTSRASTPRRLSKLGWPSSSAARFTSFPSDFQKRALFYCLNQKNLGIEGLEPSRFKEPTNFHLPSARGLYLYHHLNLSPFILPSEKVRLDLISLKAKICMIAPVESLHLSNFFVRLNWLRVSNFFISFSEFESFHFFDFSKKAQILLFKSVASTNSAISP